MSTQTGISMAVTGGPGITAARSGDAYLAHHDVRGDGIHG